ncbi:MAG TPA: OsmC family protein [Rhodothermales bacterium]
MRITVQRTEPLYEMEATSQSGWKVKMDAGVAGGGKGQGVRPTELMIMALGGCSGIDVIGILEKQRQEITKFEIELDAERADAIPAVFTRVHVHFIFEGELDPGKVRRAISLSIEKYCTVSRTLSSTATITTSFSVNGTRYD